MKKGALIGIIIALLAFALAIIYVFVFSKKDIEKAIDEFEDRDYKEAILLLNRLAKTADYETGEKIYYYRCKAVNGLAAQLEEKFSGELAEASLEKKNTESFRLRKNEVEEYLARINKKIDGDLILIPTMKKSRIIPRGKFYDEFLSRYRGSRLIEDLQFEEIQNIRKTDPDRLMSTMINFYNKYPNTDYISSIVAMLFDGLQSGALGTAGNEEILWKMILHYVKRYPTSPETNKLYICNGNNVNLRNSPGVDGKLVGKVAKDEILIQLEKSMDTTQVGDARDYWYRVASLKGPKGWLFGKFLGPVDLDKYTETEKDKKWSVEENFVDWTDSHTPARWVHVPGGDKAAINFTVRGSKKIAEVNSGKGSMAGLFSGFTPSRSFEILCRARFTGGEAVTIFASTLSEGRVYYVKLKKETVEVSGRTIPFNTSEWHEYLLESEEGRYAKLLIDGDVLSSRITPVKIGPFAQRGVYCLYSAKDENSKGEIEYIKIR
jgi:hypothetical protein